MILPHGHLHKTLQVDWSITVSRLRLCQAYRLYTVANGWFLREEDRLGSIEEGKLGDVVVLSDDYFDPLRVPDEQIRKLRSVLTVVNGKLVHNLLGR